MARLVIRKFAIAMAMAGAMVAGPVAGQGFSEGYQFLKAVKDRDGDAVTNTLNQPGSTLVNTRDITTGETALHIVTARRDSNWIKFLTQKGANPNIKDKNGLTPLQLAVRLNYIDGVEALIKAGADIDVNDSSGETPLIAAVHARNTALIRMLLVQGADPERSDNSGRSARFYAETMSANAMVINEFRRHDESKKSSQDGESYGPSF